LPYALTSLVLRAVFTHEDQLALRPLARATPKRPPHPALNVRDDAYAPLCEAGHARDAADLGQRSTARRCGTLTRRANHFTSCAACQGEVACCYLRRVIPGRALWRDPGIHCRARQRSRISAAKPITATVDFAARSTPTPQGGLMHGSTHRNGCGNLLAAIH
jgi:hypothetical protein